MFGKILGSNRITGPPGTPLAIQISLGYIIVGPAPTIGSDISVGSPCTFLTLNYMVEKGGN